MAKGQRGERKRATGGLVWDSAIGGTCPSCQQPLRACACPDEEEAPPEDSIVRVGLEKSGRGGKTVTTVRGVPLRGDALKALAKELKKRLGTGGKLAGTDIEIQGDCRDAIVKDLETRGYRVKRAGG